MVAKINHGSSFFGAIAYNHEKVLEGNARLIYGNQLITDAENRHSMDFHLIEKSFEPYLLANKKTEKPICHISINPDPKDQLTDDQYVQIAQDYLEKLGYGNQPYVVYKHEDIDRHHIHIVTVGIDETGKKINDKFEKLRSMEICRELETKYGLRPALKKDQEFGEYFIRKIDYERGDVKRQISNTVMSLIQSYKFQTLGEYNALLSLHNIDVKHVKGERFDMEYNGIVYAAKNDAGEIVSNPFKSSLFRKSFGYQGLSKIMKNSSEIIKTQNLTSRSKAIVSNAMKSAKTQDDFQNSLKSKGMDVVFRRNDEGRIYGVTFIDHENKVVLNGSRLGKEFSANVFNELFKGNANRQQEQPRTTDHPAKIQDQSNHRELDNKSTKNESSILEEIIGAFDFRAQGEDYAETAFIKKMRRKQKKKGSKIK